MKTIAKQLSEDNISDFQLEALKYAVDGLNYVDTLMREIQVCTDAINDPNVDRDTRIAFLDCRAVARELLHQVTTTSIKDAYDSGKVLIVDEMQA